jgi:hypothetical protein
VRRTSLPAQALQGLRSMHAPTLVVDSLAPVGRLFLRMPEEVRAAWIVDFPLNLEVTRLFIMGGVTSGGVTRSSDSSACNGSGR